MVVKPRTPRKDGFKKLYVITRDLTASSRESGAIFITAVYALPPPPPLMIFLSPATMDAMPRRPTARSRTGV